MASKKQIEGKSPAKSQAKAAVAPIKPKKEQAKPAKDQTKVSKKAKAAPKKPGLFSRFKNYLHNVRLEIKRATWPTRDEIFRMSLVVVGALIFFGVLIFFLDWIFTNLLVQYAGLAEFFGIGG